MFKTTTLFDHFKPVTPNKNYDDAMDRLRVWTNSAVRQCPYYTFLGNDVSDLYKTLNNINSLKEDTAIGTQGGSESDMFYALLVACNIDATYERIETSSMKALKYFVNHMGESNHYTYKRIGGRYEMRSKSGYITRLYTRTMIRDDIGLKPLEYTASSDDIRNHATRGELQNPSVLLKLFEKNPTLAIDFLNSQISPRRSTKLWIASIDFDFHSMTSEKWKVNEFIQMVLDSRVQYGTLSVNFKFFDEDSLEEQMNDAYKRAKAISALSFTLGSEYVTQSMREIDASSGKARSELIKKMQKDYAKKRGNLKGFYHAISFVKCDGRVVFCNSWGKKCSEHEELDLVIDHIRKCTFFIERP